LAFSLAIIILLGLLSDHIFKRLKLPGLVGMLLVGVLLGPYVFNMMDPAMMAVSSDFRMIALIVILLRAGLETRKDTLNRIGKTALLMSSVPAIFEGAVITLIAPGLLGISYLEAAILGSIIAAVSPAVVVPFMIKFIEDKRGTNKGIPTLILAASSVDDVFVIVVFSMLLGMYAGTNTNYFMKLLEIPVSIVLGIGIGVVAGFILYKLFIRYKPRATKKGMTVLGAAVLLTWIEEELKPFLPVSALLGVMTIGFVLLEKSESIAHTISRKLSKIWVFAEILLFVLVGAQVNIHVAWDAGLAGAAVIFIGLVARSIGTYISVMGTDLNLKERLFCVISYIPKATVQAAIGAIPLSAGVKSGDVILAVAVLSILLTAPLGALGIDISGKKFLSSGQ
jgi:NhaP-type Na+/H+ or K+/H+ antiporter